ncbi:MAG TPA: hypothetical protein VMI11_01375 [Actinomycetes bacterium]|nr:hypothetical protein [Actinomycetes bacterium]
MHARTRRLAGIGAVGAAVVAALLAGPAGASADTPTPVVVFTDAGATGATARLSVAAPDGSGVTRLTPSNLYTWSSAVSADGNTLVLGAAITTPTKNDVFDFSTGLVLVRRDVSTVTTTLLSSSYEGTPAVSADGSTVWWLYDGCVFKHANGTTTKESSGVFSPPKGYDTYGFAVSPDGTQGAAVFLKTNAAGAATAGEIVTHPLDGSSGPFVDKKYSGGPVPNPTDLAWVDNTTVFYADQTSASESGFATHTVALSADGKSGTTADGPANYYNAGKLGSDWWMWTDTGTGSSLVTHWGTTADPTVAPSSLSDRVDGQHSYSYQATAAVPPALGTPANKAGANAFLDVSTNGTTTGKKVVYLSQNLYWVPVPGTTFANDADEVDYGVLQYSTDGRKTYRTLAHTNADNPVAWPGASGYFGNGRTQALTRNTWFRWHYLGDLFTKAGYSNVQEVSVSPTVKLSVAKSGSRRTISGKAARQGGKATLYRMSGGHKTKIATVKLTSKGGFSFGKRSLAKGTYEVVVAADKSWAASTKTLKI